MVLELARLGAVDRPVPRVVDARGELVREQLAADVEQLDREHADVVEVVEQLRREALGSLLQRIPCRSPRDGEDSLAVLVLGERIERRRAVAPTHRDDRKLAVERDDRLGQLVDAEGLRRLDDTLALAVVSEPARLHERRETDLLHRAERSRCDPQPPEQLLLDEAILAELECLRVRDGIHAASRLDRDVLELVGHDVCAVGEPFE